MFIPPKALSYFSLGKRFPQLPLQNAPTNHIVRCRITKVKQVKRHRNRHPRALASLFSPDFFLTRSSHLYRMEKPRQPSMELLASSKIRGTVLPHEICCCSSGNGPRSFLENTRLPLPLLRLMVHLPPSTAPLLLLLLLRPLPRVTAVERRTRGVPPRRQRRHRDEPGRSRRAAVTIALAASLKRKRVIDRLTSTFPWAAGVKMERGVWGGLWFCQRSFPR